MSPRGLVNRPTDVKVRDQDINNKLQLYGIYQAFKNGKLPSNKQCDTALNSALDSKTLSSPSQELSEEGRALVEDLRDVIENAKKLLLSKNDGQLLQEFIWEAETISSVEMGKLDTTMTKSTAQQDGKRGLEGLKTLGTLLITNGEFRKILNDAWIIARDIAGDASQKAANNVRPSEDELAQVDQAAEENTWHEKPDFSKHKEKLSKFKKSKQTAKKDASDVVDTAVQGATDGQAESVSDLDGYAAARAGTQEAADRASERLPEDAKSRARELTDRTKGYMSKKMPKERREQMIWRMKKMVLEIQGRADYQEAIRTLLDLVEKYGGSTRNTSQQGLGAFNDYRQNDKIRTMETNLRVLTERFANSTSLDSLFDSLENIYRDADKDPELKGWFKNLNTFIRKTLQEQGYVMEDSWNREWNQLSDHGRYLLRERYRNDTDRILDEVKFLGNQFAEDPQNKAFGESMERLFNDLGRDSSGNVAFKKHLLRDIRDVILPATFENVRYVPIPRIEVSDPMADVVIENLVIESDNLMPNVVEFGSDNYFRWGRKKIKSKRDNKIMIAVSGIQADLRDVSYYINKKKGFPSLKDTGVMDIFLGGEGFSFKIAASTAQKSDRQKFVKLDKVSVKIEDLDIRLKKSSHKALFTMFKPLLFRTVRPVLEKVLEQQIRDSFEKFDSFAYDIHSEVQRAKEASIEDPAEARNIYSRYFDTFRQRMAENKKKAQEVAARDTKINTATTLYDSIFPEIRLPGGISSKATEYRELAQKGERWESPVFTLGTADESTDIPSAAAITRKSATDAQDGSAAVASGTQVTNGVTNGTTHKVTNGSHAAGAATNGHSKLVDGVATNGASKLDGPTVPGTEKVFNPQTA
ncbi:hypothetical protein FE257_004047 [Aspergillus nanangensis]|uniref:Uncharacterized protein n=1 Tax=Aspergillus nanangensis TaxID=2582783 RepID=A0AAD4CBC1_ASPNN|nr:hypothetical protein FE257_004047 [Aspergillus nanangensis]